MAAMLWRATGEIVEREDLLDGRAQVVLDGAADAAGHAGGEAAVALTLVWLLGREGEVPLLEGYITVSHGGGELNASLQAGAAEVSAETGAAVVRATFLVDAVEGGLAAPGARIACELEVGAEEWRGELRLDAGASPGPPSGGA